MKVFYYNYMGIWLHCFAKSRADAMEKVGFLPEEMLTEKEAQRRADNGDTELADYIQSTYLCELMCR